MDEDDEYLYGGPPESAANQPTVPQPIPVDTLKTASPLVEQLEEQVQSTGDEDDDIFPVSPPQQLQPLAQPSQRESTEEQVDIADDGEVDEENEDDEQEEDSDDDIEIIMERPSHSLDLRPSRPSGRTTASTAPTQPRAPAPSLTTEYNPIQRGGAIPNALHAPPLPPSTPSLQQQQQQQHTSLTPSSHLQNQQPHQNQNLQQQDDDGIDASTLPSVRAPPSHPDIDPEVVGMFDGRSILEVDLNAMADKPWRRPGSDISDWFNYGFDEISWEAYCYRRRDVGDVANVLKTNVINFAGMGEDQITALPPELRQMIMTGTTAMMNGGINVNGGAGGNPQATAAAAAVAAGMMNPQMLMEMSGMMMNMGDMATAAQLIQQFQQAQEGGGMGGVGMGVGTPEQVPVQVPGGPGGMMMQDGFAGAQGMMNMGMGGDFAMQMQDQNQMQMFQNMDGANVPGQVGQGGGVGAGAGGSGGPSSTSGTPIPGSGATPGSAASTTPGGTIPSVPGGAGASTPSNVGVGPGVSPGIGRGNTPIQPYRGAGAGRGAPIQNMAIARGRGFVGGRGRGVSAPVRPASPLPPNVPTGPRNQNKYKDRDGNAPAVDGLDYGGGGAGGGGGGGGGSVGGERERDRDRDRDRDRERDRDRDRERGGKDDRGRRTPSAELEERSSSRKRRSSPMEDSRSSKRR